MDKTGDNEVRRLLDRRTSEVADVTVEGLVPLDVDTWEDQHPVVGART